MVKSVPGEFKRKNQHFICAHSVCGDVCRRAFSEVTFRVCRQPGWLRWVRAIPARVFSNFSLKPPKLSNLSAIELTRDEYFNGGRRFFFSNACLLPTALELSHNGLCKFETATLFRTPESLSPVASTQFRSAVSLSINVLLCSRENIYGPRNIFCWWNKLKENTLKWISISITHSQVFGFYWITISSLIETQMVVLEGANDTMPMLTIGNTQYLQPDYLSPNPTMVRIYWK